MRIAVLGLGNMGQALTLALAGSGRDVRAWNRTLRDLPALATAGVRIETQPARALDDADLVLLITLSYASLAETLQPLADRLAQKILVPLCSGLPDDASAFAAWAAAQGARSLDVAIMGYPSDIGSERALFLHAGEISLFEQVRPQLAPLGPRHRHVGTAPGLAKTFDNALLARNYAWMMSYLQSAALAKAAGLDTTLFTDVAMDLLGPLFNNIQRAKAEIAAAHFAPATQASLAVHEKALSVVVAMARRCGARTPLLDEAHGVMSAALAAGAGDREIAACFTQFLPA